MIKLKHLLLRELWMPGPMGTSQNKSPLSYTSQENDDLLSYVESTTKQDNPDWFMATGTNNWQDKKAYCSAYITESGKPSVRIWVEVKTRWLRKPNDTHSSHHERVRKAIGKVAKAWSNEAKRLHKEPQLSEIGNQKTRTWRECFAAALKSPKVSPFIMECGEDEASTMDPVNFTPRKL
jgi:hypothetical protein